MFVYCTVLPIDFFFLFMLSRQFYLPRELQGRYLRLPIKGSNFCSWTAELDGQKLVKLICICVYAIWVCKHPLLKG